MRAFAFILLGLCALAEHTESLITKETALLQKTSLVSKEVAAPEVELVQLRFAPKVSAPAAATPVATPVAVKLHDAPLVEMHEASLVTSHGSSSLVHSSNLVEVDFRQQPPTTVTNQSWLERMQESFTQLILGWIMFIFSIPVLWFNERRSARMESLIARASQQVRSIDAGSPDTESRDWLVHVQNAPMHAAEEVKDKQFDVSMGDGCIRLQSEVQVFQHVEKQNTEKKERLGGGQETTTTYSYSEEWSSTWQDSSSFADKGKVNSKPSGVELGTSTADCARVEFGSAFLLPQGLVEQCNAWLPAEKLLGKSVRVSGGGGPRFTKGAEGAHFFWRPSNANWSGEAAPMVGDARVRFLHVPDSSATVMALQAGGSERDTFLPYRLISLPWCGGGLCEEEEKGALRLEAEKDSGQLSADGQCGGGICPALCCCACNLVSMCFSAVLTPEIFHLWQCDMNKAACLTSITERNQTTTLLIRLGGWVLMFVGLYMTFSPLLTLVVVIPFLGPILSNFGAWLIWVLCLVTTLLMSTVIIIFAYLAYHPMKALLYTVFAASICMATVFASRALTA